MLEINDNRAIAKNIDLKKISVLSSRLEGRKKILASGSYQFEPTPANIEAFTLVLPDVPVDDKRHSFSVFDGVALDLNRPQFAFKRPPMPHQIKAFDHLKDKSLWAVFGAPGTGKSLILTTLLTHKWCAGAIDAVLIVSINGVVMQQWPDLQLPRDIPDNVPWECWVWKKGKRASEDYDRMVASDKLKIVSINIDALNTKDGYALCERFITAHNGRVAFILDESQVVKNPSAQRTKKARALAKQCSLRAIASGTPIAKDLTDLWSQMALLDERIIGHKYKGAFQNEYCRMRHNGFALVVVGVQEEKLEQLYRKIDPVTFRITKEELGFRDFDDEFEFVLGEKEKEHFTSLKKDFLARLDNGEFLTASNAMSATIRMQQASNGFLPYEDGSGFMVLEKSRIAALKSYLEILDDKKIVIWARFKMDVTLLLEEFGAEAVNLSGLVSAAERTANKNVFLTDPTKRFAIGTPKAAGVGTDGIQEVTNRAIFYSNSEHWLDFSQARARTSRVGGEANAFYTHLIAKGTPDRKILANLTGKTEMSKMSLDDIRQMIHNSEV